MRRFLSWVLIALCVLQPSLAMETNRQKKRDSIASNEVRMPFLIAPVNRNGQFVGYHYIATKLVAPSKEAAELVKQKLPHIQDALVRNVYREPATALEDALHVDEAVLGPRILAVIRQVAGAKNADKIVFIDVKFAPLHPLANGDIFLTQADSAGQSGDQQQNDKNEAAGEQAATSQHQKDAGH